MSADERWEIAGLTDTGRTRARNEDAIGWDHGIGLVVLADGMGGHNGGSIASGMAVESAKAGLRKVLAQDSDGARITPSDLSLVVELTLNKTNQAIYQAAAAQPHYAGMGTTVVLAVFADDHVIVAHVGDSRLYRLRGELFEQLTRDHSLVQELLQSGFLSEKEARSSSQRNIITRALGIGAEVKADVQQQRIERGDVYLFCSDGLSNLVGDCDIQASIRKFDADLTEAVHDLVQMANDRGGYDNISAILVRIK